MQIVTTESVARGKKSINFKFNYNRLDEAVDAPAGTYLIDLNGYIYTNGSSGQHAEVTLYGGDNRFIFEKSFREGSPHLTTKQKVALHGILAHLARYTAYATVTADDEYLDVVVNSLYRGARN